MDETATPVADAPAAPVEQAAPEAAPALSQLMEQYDSSLPQPDEARAELDRQKLYEEGEALIEARVAERVAALQEQLGGEWEEQAQLAAMQAADKADVHNAVQTLKARNPNLSGFPDQAVQALLEHVANHNPDIAEAFANRIDDPVGWMQSFQQQVQQEVGRIAAALPANTVRNELDAAAAAVRNATNERPGPEQPDGRALQRMSDREFAAYKDRLRDEPGYRP